MPSSEAEFLVESNEENVARRRKHIMVGGAAIIVTVSVIVILVMIFAVDHKSSPPAPAKLNVIMMISDGWGPAAATLARSFQQKALNIDPYIIGTVRTLSADSLVTDSAAGATAYSCGVHTYNGGIGVDANGKAVGTVLEAAARKGMRTGVVSTTRVTDATPGAFCAHATYRSQEDYIALQILDEAAGLPLKNIDVVLGGGRAHFQASTRTDGFDLLQVAKNKNYSVVQDADELALVTSGKVLGLFSDYNMAYSIDRTNNLTINASQPSLPVMAKKALDLLTNENGFFVMLEGALIDVAEHGNDAASAVREVLQYDETFQLALDYAKAHGNTVIISTSDHETGGLTLGLQTNLAPGAYPPYAYYPQNLVAFNASCDSMAERIMAGQNVTNVVAASSNITDLTNEEIEAILANIPFGLSGVSGAIGRILSIRSLIGWTTHGHTGVDVNLYVYGLPEGTKYNGNHENIDIATLIADLLDLDIATISKELIGFPTNNVTTQTVRVTARDIHKHYIH